MGGRQCFGFGLVGFFLIMQIYVEGRVCHSRTPLWWAAGQSCAAPEVGQLVCKGHGLTRETQSCTASLRDDKSFPLRPASFSGFRSLPPLHSHGSIPSRRTGFLYGQPLKRTADVAGACSEAALLKRFWNQFQSTAFSRSKFAQCRESDKHQMKVAH